MPLVGILFEQIVCNANSVGITKAITRQIDYHSPDEGHETALTTSEEDDTANKITMIGEGMASKERNTYVSCVITLFRSGTENTR